MEKQIEKAVALLAEGVDRNQFIISNGQSKKVALLAEGVDRNLAWEYWMPKIGGVALLAEGVDRNNTSQGMLNLTTGRPPRGGRG